MKTLESKVIIALQARTNSTRLPGKVLLPIAGIPLVVLASKRASSIKWNVITLTSKEETDDYLCDVLATHKQSIFRGSLNNVLSRYVEAFEFYSDDAIIVRLTADNVYPDAVFIENVISQFCDDGLNYICADNENSLLPYGLSVEVTRLGCLREALKNTADVFDLEHVTPYIRRKYGVNYFKPEVLVNYSALRCTVDTLDDYLKVAKVFQLVDNPLTIDATDLIRIQQSVEEKNLNQTKLALGCVQLGMNYGITNKLGKPSLGEAHELLSVADRLGIAYFDTARAYGESESVIGQWLSNNKAKVKVITKLSPLSGLKASSNDCQVKQLVKDSVCRSVKELGVDSIHVLMLHRAHHINSYHGSIIETLKEFKNVGLIKELGVSVQTPQELCDVLDNEAITYIQLPFNILDFRWLEVIDKIKLCKVKRQLNIHVRSALLQGLLISDDPKLWKRAHVNDYARVSRWLKMKAKMLGCGSTHELCLRYVASQDWVDAVVVGAESVQQLLNNYEVLQKPTIKPQDMTKLASEAVGMVSLKSLDPSTWDK